MPTLTIRPSAAGNSATHTPNGAASNWDCCDEAVSDDGVTYVSNVSSGMNNICTDRYNLQNSTGQSGQITSVEVFMKVRCATIGSTQTIATNIRTVATNFSGVSNDITAQIAFIDFSTVYTLNPATNAEWTWSQIDALQAGVFSVTDGGAEVQCTQVWVVVTYVQDINVLEITALQPTFVMAAAYAPSAQMLNILALQPRFSMSEFDDFETFVFDPRARIPTNRSVKG